MWWRLLQWNQARPRAVFILWLAYHEKLATKEILCRFGFITNDRCSFCNEQETFSHLLFSCGNLKLIWKRILNWLEVGTTPSIWKDDIHWEISNCKRKWWKMILLKCSLVEIAYGFRNYNNVVCFANRVDSDLVVYSTIN